MLRFSSSDTDRRRVPVALYFKLQTLIIYIFLNTGKKISLKTVRVWSRIYVKDRRKHLAREEFIWRTVETFFFFFSILFLFQVLWIFPNIRLPIRLTEILRTFNINQRRNKNNPSILSELKFMTLLDSFLFSTYLFRMFCECVYALSASNLPYLQSNNQ